MTTPFDPNQSAESDQVMAGLLNLDSAPEHGADFWAQLDAELVPIEAARTGTGAHKTRNDLLVVPLDPAQSGAGDTAESVSPLNEGKLIVGPWLRNNASMLAAAAAVILLVVFTANLAFDNSADPVDIVVTDTPPDSSGDGETNPTDGVESDSSGTDDETSTEEPQTGESSPDGEPVEATPPTQASWPIAIGTGVGIAPDESAALVMAMSAYGGIGCRGGPKHELWRIPFDGSAPEMASNPDNTLHLTHLAHRDGQAAWSAACDGFSGGVSLGPIATNGMLSEVETSIDVFGVAGITDSEIRRLSFDVNGRLRVDVSSFDNTRKETLFFDGTELVERGTDASTTITAPPSSENWSLHHNGVVLLVAAPLTELQYFGPQIQPDLSSPPAALAATADYSAIYSAAGGTAACDAYLLQTRLATGLVDIIIPDLGMDRVERMDFEGDLATITGLCEGERFTVDIARSDLLPVISAEEVAEASAAGAGERDTVAISWGSGIALSEDRSAILVESYSTSGRLSCEGTPELALFRIPFDSEQPQVTEATSIASGGVDHFVQRDGKAAWSEWCDGTNNGWFTADIAPNGMISAVTAVDGVLDPFVEVRALRWLDDGLGVWTTAGSMAVYDGSTIVRSGSDPMPELDPPDPGDWQFLTLPMGPGSAAAPTTVVTAPSGVTLNRSDRFETPGPGQAIPGINGTVATILATSMDVSGWIATTEFGADCAGELVFIPFDERAPYVFGPAIPANPFWGIQVAQNPGGEGSLLVTANTCDTGTEIYVGDNPLNDGVLNLVGPALRPLGPGPLPDALTATELTVSLPDGVGTGNRATAVINRDTSEVRVTASGGTSPGWPIYNARFGFTVAVTQGWSVGPPPQNNDGWVITHESGTEVRVFGTFDTEGSATREGGFETQISESTIELTAESLGDYVDAQYRRLDFGLSGLPNDVIDVAIVAPDRAVVFTATVPNNDPAARDAAEELLTSLVVNARMRIP